MKPLAAEGISGGSRVESSFGDAAGEGVVRSGQMVAQSVSDPALCWIVIWYLLTGRPSSPMDRTSLGGSSDSMNRPFALVAHSFFEEKALLEARLRRLVARALVRGGGCLQRGHGLRALGVFISSFWRSPSCFVREVTIVAQAECARRRAEAFLLQTRFSDLIEAEKSGDLLTPIRTFQELEQNAVQIFLGDHPHTAEFIRSAIAHDYKDLLVRTLWMRHGPVTLMVIATVSAFIVSGVIWHSATDLSLVELVRGWWRFLGG